MIARRTVFLIVALIATATVSAQQGALQRDVDFVRKLATELRFISLAQTEVDRLQADYKDSDDFKAVQQLGIEISLVGARSDPNRERRRTLFKDALDRSTAFIGRFEGEAVADQARLTMVEACYEYGRFLLDEIDIAREEAPDQVKDLEETAATAYRDGIKACEQVMDRLADGSSEEGSVAQRDYFRTWLFKAVLQREMARAVKRDREPLAQIARDTFEEFIFEVGEETAMGLRGWFEMSKVGEILGNYKEAVSDYNDTIDSIKTALGSDELDLSPEAQEFLFNLMQEAYDRAAESMFLSGDVDKTLELVAAFRADLEAFGEKGADLFEIAHPTFGHPVFLTEARALSETGDSTKVGNALAQAQKINDAHPNDIIGVKAKNVLKDILRVQSTMVSGALLFEVAKGDYQSREYMKAIQGFKKAYAAMSDDERRKDGLELWSTMGKCYALEKRYLHGTMAVTMGLETHGGDEGDPESSAELLEQFWQGYQRDSKNHQTPAVAALEGRVMQMQKQYGGQGSVAKQSWRDGNRFFANKEYDKAIAKYREISNEDDDALAYYEPAQGRIVAALQSSKKFNEARQAIAAYQAWIQTPKAEIPPRDSQRETTRKVSLGMMAFYAAFMDYVEATRGDQDRTKFQPTIAKFEAFLDEHGEYAPNYVGRSYDCIARLQAKLGQIDKAEETYRTLRSAQPNSALVPLLATQIFRTHYDTVKSLTTEFDALIKKSAAQAEVDAVSEKLDVARKAALASGLDYLKNSNAPQYGVLWNTLEIATDLGDWKNSEQVGRRIIADFSEGDEASKVERFVKPKLGQALLEQRNFKAAVPLLEAAVGANDKNYDAKRFLSLAQGGWFELDRAGNLTEVAGQDDPVPAYRRHYGEYRKYLLAKGMQDFSIEWYQFQLECYMFAMRAKAKDSDFKRIAGIHFRKAQSTDSFERLKAMGPQGQKIFGLFRLIR